MSEQITCENQPSWYKQLFKFDASKREAAHEFALKKIKEAKPEAYDFIQKFGCKLVGFMPNVVYTCPDDSRGIMDYNFVHDFSQYTLLYWCENGGFGFFINASLKFDDEMGFTY